MNLGDRILLSVVTFQKNVFPRFQINDNAVLELFCHHAALRTKGFIQIFHRGNMFFLNHEKEIMPRKGHLSYRFMP